MINKNSSLGCIKIDELVVYANHGVLQEEKIMGQKFVISAKMYAPLQEAIQTDDLSKTINYASVCHLITKLTQEKKYDLIETLAGVLAQKIMEENDIIEYIEIEVKKPFAPINLPFECVSVVTSKKRHKAYLSLGSNMGDKENYINKAIELLEEDNQTQVTQIASFIETKPYGNVEQDDFLNTAVEIKTLRSPIELLKLANEIEEKLGRVRTIKWGPRTIDLDIIFYDEEVINEPNLIVPHKEMHLREFVLKPLVELEPTYVHPLYKKNIFQIYENLKENVIKYNN